MTETIASTSLDYSMLRNFGDIENYSLSHILEASNIPEDEEPSLINHSPYVNNESLINILKSKNDILKCISLNVQSINAKFNEFKIYIQHLYENGCSFDIICLQETWLKDGSDTSLLQLDGYKSIYQCCKSTMHGGLAIYVKNDIKYEIIPLYPSPSNLWEGLFIKLTVTHNKLVTIGNIYRPPRNSIEEYQTFIDEIDDVMKHLRGEIVIGGDMNIDLLKIREKNIFNDYFENIISNGFIPKITLPTRLTRNNGTLIDNFLCKISQEFSKTSAGIITYKLSDHLPYFVSLDYLKIKSSSSNKYVKISCSTDANIAKFKEYLLNENIQSQLDNNNSLDPNTNYETLDQIIQTGINKCMPSKIVKYNKHRHKNKEWITTGLIKSIKFRDKLYQKLKNTCHNLPLYDQLKVNLGTYNQILRKAIREAKRNHFHKKFTQYKNDIKNTWITIRNIFNTKNNQPSMPDFFLINNNRVTDRQTIADDFNNFFVNVGKNLASQISAPSNKSYNDYLYNPSRVHLNFKKISDTDTLTIINNLQAKTSKGPDFVSSALLKKIKIELHKPITYIINQSLESGLFPDKLKVAKIIPVHKKGIETSIENYRPISILPAISKIFEKVLFNQIHQHFKENNLYYAFQYGFRESHSTELAVLEIIDRISHSMDQGNIPLNVYIDLSKAFDTIDHTILLTKLKHYGLHDTSHALIQSYLTNRQQYVQIENVKSTPLPITTGVPQGSILGPLLFIIYINDLSHTSNLLHFTSYADDTTIFISLTYQNQNISLPSEQTLNNELNNLSEWMKLNKLSLNVSKTKCMAFHTPGKRFTPPIVKIDNCEIEYVDMFPLLGILLHKNLNWSAHQNHINKKIAKVTCLINQLKNFLPIDT
jgi:hypothetical protein